MCSHCQFEIYSSRISSLLTTRQSGFFHNCFLAHPSPLTFRQPNSALLSNTTYDTTYRLSRRPTFPRIWVLGYSPCAERDPALPLPPPLPIRNQIKTMMTPQTKIQIQIQAQTQTRTRLAAVLLQLQRHIPLITAALTQIPARQSTTFSRALMPIREDR